MCAYIQVLCFLMFYSIWCGHKICKRRAASGLSLCSTATALRVPQLQPHELLSVLCMDPAKAAREG